VKRIRQKGKKDFGAVQRRDGDEIENREQDIYKNNGGKNGRERFRSGSGKSAQQRGKNQGHKKRLNFRRDGRLQLLMLMILILMNNFGAYKIIGETRDDAAGECFDKTARILGLGYPGGQIIAAYAATKLKTKNEKVKIKLPRPMLHTKDYDFSFSGLKTAVLYMLRDMKERHINIGDFTPMICNEIQQAIIDVLITKTMKAAKEFGIKSIILGGGVAANKELRAQMKKAVGMSRRDLDIGGRQTIILYLPSAKLTTDNAAMIGAAGYLRAVNGDFAKPEKLVAQGNLSL